MSAVCTYVTCRDDGQERAAGEREQAAGERERAAEGGHVGADEGSGPRMQSGPAEDECGESPLERRDRCFHLLPPPPLHPRRRLHVAECVGCTSVNGC